MALNENQERPSADVPNYDEHQVVAALFRPCSVCVPSEPGNYRKMTIDDHRLTASSGKRSRICVLVADGYAQQHPDLRGHQPDPSMAIGPPAPRGMKLGIADGRRASLVSGSLPGLAWAYGGRHGNIRAPGPA